VLTYTNGTVINLNDAVRHNGSLAYVDRVDRAIGQVRIWLLKTPENVLFVTPEELEFLEAKEKEE